MSKLSDLLCLGDQIPIVYLSALEIDIGIICACLPSIQALIKPVQSWSRALSRASKGVSKSDTSTRDTVQQVKNQGDSALLPTEHGSGSADATQASTANITKTTTISRRDGIYDGESGISLDDLNFNPGTQGEVRVRAWA